MYTYLSVENAVTGGLRRNKWRGLKRGPRRTFSMLYANLAACSNHIKTLKTFPTRRSLFFSTT